MSERVFAALVLLAAVFVRANAQTPNGVGAASACPTIEQAISLKSVSNPHISPDGRYVAYEVPRVNWENNTFETDIWLAVTLTGERYPLTNGKKSSMHAAWSRDGKWIAFLSDRDAGKRQIFLISPAGGEARQLTRVEPGVVAFEWSPDGRHIAFTAPDAESRTRKDRIEKYGNIEVLPGDFAMTHLWMIDVSGDATEKSAEPQRLTEGTAFTIGGAFGGFRWSPDGRRIAFSAASDPDLNSMDTFDIYVLSAADKSVKKLVETKGPDFGPIWSPDGKQIAFETANGHDDSFIYKNFAISVIPAEGGVSRVLTQAFDENAFPITWSLDGIYFSSLQKTYAHLFRLNPSTGAIVRISGPDHFLATDFSFRQDFEEVAFLGAADNAYVELYISKLSPFAPRPLTAMGDQLKSCKLSRREIIEWKSKDGTPIEGVLIKPADLDASRKYPLLVVIHGGPPMVDQAIHFITLAEQYYPIEQFVAKGALILQPNYRGSTGYGEKFRSMNVHNLGVGDYADIISGVDSLISKGWVDKDRVGVMGWSQGGFISAYIATTSDRFKAVSVGAGVSDWVANYSGTDLRALTRQYMGGSPWDDENLEFYRKISPITNFKTARTPTLIQHGELDPRIPIINGYELYYVLRARGVPVKMIVYKGFGHDIDKPKQRRAVIKENYDWFSQWIWGEEPATDETSGR